MGMRRQQIWTEECTGPREGEKEIECTMLICSICAIVLTTDLQLARKLSVILYISSTYFSATSNFGSTTQATQATYT
jgi:hypothetical protein